MRYVLPILLLCLLFENSFTSRRSTNLKLSKEAKALKRLANAKEQLINVDVTDEGGDSETETIPEAENTPETSLATNPPVVEYSDTSKTDEGEKVSAAANNSEVDASKPVATVPKQTNEKKKNVQIQNIYGFKLPPNPDDKTVSFKLRLYFWERLVARLVLVRLRIDYNSRLRNLAPTSESARTDCELVDPSLEGKILGEGEGENVNYNCKANATQGDPSKANFTLNTDVPMTIINKDGNPETLNFDEINFNGNSAEESVSLQISATREISSFATIKDAIASVNQKFLIISGKYEKMDSPVLRNLDLTNGATINMNLDDKSGTTKTYDCVINGVTKGGNSELSCDTSGNPIDTNSEIIHLSQGNTQNNDYLTIEMLNAGNSTTDLSTYSSGNRYSYSKSSSGLSGGAIAGIVIACVVVLAAASIAAVMLRKPSPPIENTTIVDLKTDNI